MATVAVTHPGAGLDTRTAIRNAAVANPNDTLYLGSNISSTWEVTGRVDPLGHGDLVDAEGAVELNNNKIHLGTGVTVRENHATPTIGRVQSLFRWLNKSNTGLIFEPGSSLYGRREDHADGSELRAGAKFISCNGVEIQGQGEAHIKNWGGDGIWLCSGDNWDTGANLRVLINYLLLNDNYRHGLTIEDANDCRVLRCGGTGNDGTGSSHWCDIEPDESADKLIDVYVQGGYHEGHAVGITIDLHQMDSNSSPVNVIVEDVTSGKSADAGDDPWGFRVKNSAGAGPLSGTIEYRNGRVENLRYAGIRVQWDLASGVLAKFTGCNVYRCATAFEKPISLVLEGAPTGAGILFDDLIVEETLDRIITEVSSSGGVATNVRGRIFVDRGGLKMSTSQLQTLLPNLNVQRYTKQHKRRHRIALERVRVRDRELLPRVDFGREA